MKYCVSHSESSSQAVSVISLVSLPSPTVAVLWARVILCTQWVVLLLRNTGQGLLLMQVANNAARAKHKMLVATLTFLGATETTQILETDSLCSLALSVSLCRDTSLVILNESSPTLIASPLASQPHSVEASLS